MSKNVHYLLLLIALVVFTGCQTVNTTPCNTTAGSGQDTYNASDSDQNSCWNPFQKADAWVQENMW